MKRIEFVLPVESMRGNLSGEQTLVYAQNNNPAYEAPNGTQYARNYQGRYIGSKVSKSGLKYFNVKTKSATVLNDSTRLTMGTLAAVSAIRSALMKDHAQDYAQIIANLVMEVTQGILSGTGKRTVMSLFFEKVSAMLQGMQDTVTFTGSTPVVVSNPWCAVQTSGSVVLTISQPVWVKYAPLFYNEDNIRGGANFRINGQLLFAPYAPGLTYLEAWTGLKSQAITCPNFVALFRPLTVSQGVVTWYESDVYLNGVKVNDDDNVIANAKYTA